MAKDYNPVDTILYMTSFTRGQMDFLTDNEYWQEGDFNERLQKVIVKGIEAVKAGRT